MNWMDIFLIIPLIWGLYKGFSKGLIIEAATLIALGLAVWSAVKFHDFLLVWIRDVLGWTYQYLPLISFALIFLGILLVVMGIAKLIERFMKAVSLGFFNKLGGAIFGMLKFGLLLSMIIFLAEAVNKNFSFIPEEIKSNSLLYEPVRKIAPAIIPALQEGTLEKMGIVSNTAEQEEKSFTHPGFWCCMRFRIPVSWLPLPAKCLFQYTQATLLRL